MNGHAGSTTADGLHRYPVRVYFEDTDAGGIAYHASYLRFAERGRTEALRDLGVPHAEMVERHNRMFVVRRLEIDYLRPARLDDLLTVVTQPVRVRAASVLLKQWFERGRERLVEMDLLLACVAPHGERAERIPPPWREALERMQAQAGAKTDRSE